MSGMYTPASTHSLGEADLEPRLTREQAATIEDAALDALYEAAEKRQREYEAKSPHPPRFLTESARSMARHLGLDDPTTESRIRELAFWQFFLPGALMADRSLFVDAQTSLPRSFAAVKEGMRSIESHRQVVFAGFHMVGLPVLSGLMGAASPRVHRPGAYTLVSRRNLGWFRTEAASWLGQHTELVTTEPAGLRRVISGLRDGSVERLMVFVDGPHPPDAPGAFPLSGLSPALAFRTSLLARVLSMGIPIVPVAHFWESRRLAIRWYPPLDPEQGIAQLARLIEDLVRSYPEQWLNWPAASLRT